MVSFAEKPPASGELSPAHAAAEGGRTLVRSLPLRDRLIILSALGIVTLLAWVYLVDAARAMERMAGGEMQMAWTADYFVAMFLMWAIMMIGMMVPSAIPMVLIHAAIARKATREGKTTGADWTFCCRLRSDLDCVQRCGHDRPMGIGSGFVALIHDDDEQSDSGRHIVTRGRALPIDADEKCMSAALPIACSFHRKCLAARLPGRGTNGRRSRRLLPRLLLDSHVSPLFWRSDEHLVDRRPNDLCSRWKK